MKLVIREYLASLRERDELDAVLPDLLTELGLTVYSRPARGTRQYGVDVAAVGLGSDGVRRVHLFSVKSGDLSRRDWDTDSPQSLRPSLNEIRDVYIRTRIPREYSDLPIAICMCFGGAIDEQVRAEVTGYIESNTTDRITFEEWNGDRLAQVIIDGILREELLYAPLRSHLRKAVAMVEQPDIALNHFRKLLYALSEQPGATTEARLSQARLINISLWIMFAWAREANNVKAPLEASEYAVLEVWHLLRKEIAGSARSTTAAGLILNELFELHLNIWRELFDKKILPHSDVRHAVSSAVGTDNSLDVNLKLFEMLGQISLRGIWLLWELSPLDGPVLLSNDFLLARPKSLRAYDSDVIAEIDQLCNKIVEIMENNRTLFTPVGDWQAIDIGLAFTLLSCRPKFHGVIGEWAEEIVKRSIFSYEIHGRYPITSQSYQDLVYHPMMKTDEYRQDVTQGSILYPMLAIWADALGNQDLVDRIAMFQSSNFEHCTFQAWLPDQESEEKIYLGRENHGAALTEIPVIAGAHESMKFVFQEIAINPHYDTLSAVKFGHWPIILMACRAYRLPVPPQIWRALLPELNL